MCRLSKDTIQDILSSGRIYEVGGAVRDRYLSESTRTKDRDYLVTGISYDELSDLLKRHGRVDLVGQSFGVIKFTEFHKKKQHTYDITLPRREQSTGTGHKEFAVDFDPHLSVEDDLERRDFTINAMALALDSEKLIDPLHGMVDLKNRQLRMTSATSFQDDPLRMIRAVQFAARFQFIVEPNTFKAMRSYAALISTVSAERIAEELNKLLLLAKKPSDGFRLMQSSGLLALIMPELNACVGVEQPGGYHRYDVFEHTLLTIDAAPARLPLRLAALFHDITKPRHKRVVEKGATFYGHEVSGALVAQEVMSRLRYSKELINTVSMLVQGHMFTTNVSDKGLRRLIRRIGQENIFDLLDLRRADVVAQGMGGSTDDVDELESAIRSELERKPPFGVADLALNGKDIMKLFNIAPSPVVGRILDQLLEKVLDRPEDNSPERLESFARESYLQESKQGNIKSHEESSE